MHLRHAKKESTNHNIRAFNWGEKKTTENIIASTLSLISFSYCCCCYYFCIIVSRTFLHRKAIIKTNITKWRNVCVSVSFAHSCHSKNRSHITLYKPVEIFFLVLNRDYSFYFVRFPLVSLSCAMILFCLCLYAIVTETCVYVFDHRFSFFFFFFRMHALCFGWVYVVLIRVFVSNIFATKKESMLKSRVWVRTDKSTQNSHCIGEWYSGYAISNSTIIITIIIVVVVVLTMLPLFLA